MSDNILNLREKYLASLTPLMSAVLNSDINKVKQLLELGADVLAVNDYDFGNGILYYAARQDNLEIIKILLDTDVDINQKDRDSYKQSPIFTALTQSGIPVLKTFLERGANPDIQDKYKMTTLHWAVTREGQIEAIKTLLKFGANVNTKNHKGITPLISAVITGIMEYIQILVLAGAEMNTAAKDGFTELMYASYYGHEEIVKYLLANDADKNAIAKKGETALSIAKKKNFDSIVVILESN
ncbi:ankyrin repeat domain-containing protein [Flavobacterium fluviale]|uniref:Uncharacterized protein n=1 Tax=Flavobacterium fluviale TaxID=2249356 RepID=A0A344LRN5_9FLAO|nr:ankyrin repeat domain-containing protein [Flavobacterium fluviale]AXB56577.1 hypothetical protein HYN86_08150 [Flavobacterium fluviale]